MIYEMIPISDRPRRSRSRVHGWLKEHPLLPSTSCPQSIVMPSLRDRLDYLTEGQYLQCEPDTVALVATCMKGHDVPTAGHRGIRRYHHAVERKSTTGPRCWKDFHQCIATCPRVLGIQATHTQGMLAIGRSPDSATDLGNGYTWTYGPPKESPPTETGQSSRFIDAHARFLIAVARPNHQAKTVIDAFLNHVALVFGFPQEIVSDGGPELVSVAMKQLYLAMGIKHHLIFPYHPQPNGKVERVFRTLRPKLASVVRRNPASWPDYLPYVVYAYNSSYHHTIRNTPMYIMTGTGSLLRPHINGEVELTSPISSPRLTKLARARDLVRTALERRTG